MTKRSPIPKRYAHLDPTATTLRRSFQNALGRRPSAIEVNAIVLAATLASRAAEAAADRAIGHGEAAAIAGAAAAARERLALIIEARKAATP
jgi:hypothetical protein